MPTSTSIFGSRSVSLEAIRHAKHAPTAPSTPRNINNPSRAHPVSGTGTIPNTQGSSGMCPISSLRPPPRDRKCSWRVESRRPGTVTWPSTKYQSPQPGFVYRGPTCRTSGRFTIAMIDAPVRAWMRAPQRPAPLTDSGRQCRPSALLPVFAPRREQTVVSGVHSAADSAVRSLASRKGCRRPSPFPSAGSPAGARVR